MSSQLTVPPLELTQMTLHGVRRGPRLLITAGVHGDEFEPMAAVRRLMRTIDPMQLSGRVILVPVVNEPALRRGSRVAEDGLDLARTCPGRADGSVTERIAHALSRLIRSADFYIDLHTGGSRLKLLPLAGYMLHRDEAVLAVQRRMARAFNLPLVWGTSANLNGRSLSVARDANIPAIYVEHGGGGGWDPLAVEECVAGCLNVLAELEMLQATPPARRAEHVVEDDRDQSGHLQINHSSPMDGFFEPAVRLGQQVHVRELIGTVCNALGDEAQHVLAAEAGMIIMLRTQSAVKQGDSLAATVAVART